jgi:hypothetical protein
MSSARREEAILSSLTTPTVKTDSRDLTVWNQNEKKEKRKNRKQD